ncbi:hypothetical protein S1OALGB6SA_2429 [Olavius algarvensis spirochete endosymbiont]|nr:hypothetical protein S1OALGB6SA_2429 [Olavius algarvensis spirochete endosymbiont]
MLEYRYSILFFLFLLFFSHPSYGEDIVILENDWKKLKERLAKLETISLKQSENLNEQEVTLLTLQGQLMEAKNELQKSQRLAGELGRVIEEDKELHGQTRSELESIQGLTERIEGYQQEGAD